MGLRITENAKLLKRVGNSAPVVNARRAFVVVTGLEFGSSNIATGDFKEILRLQRRTATYACLPSEPRGRERADAKKTPDYIRPQLPYAFCKPPPCCSASALAISSAGGIEMAETSRQLSPA